MRKCGKVNNSGETLLVDFEAAPQGHVWFLGAERETQLWAMYRLVGDLSKIEAEEADERRHRGAPV